MKRRAEFDHTYQNALYRLVGMTSPDTRVSIRYAEDSTPINAYLIIAKTDSKGNPADLTKFRTFAKILSNKLKFPHKQEYREFGVYKDFDDKSICRFSVREDENLYFIRMPMEAFMVFIVEEESLELYNEDLIRISDTL